MLEGSPLDGERGWQILDSRDFARLCHAKRCAHCTDRDFNATSKIMESSSQFVLEPLTESLPVPTSCMSSGLSHKLIIFLSNQQSLSISPLSSGPRTLPVCPPLPCPCSNFKLKDLKDLESREGLLVRYQAQRTDLRRACDSLWR